MYHLQYSSMPWMLKIFQYKLTINNNFLYLSLNLDICIYLLSILKEMANTSMNNLSVNIVIFIVEKKKDKENVLIISKSFEVC